MKASILLNDVWLEYGNAFGETESVDVEFENVVAFISFPRWKRTRKCRWKDGQERHLVG
jgi:hypothetical protein